MTWSPDYETIASNFDEFIDNPDFYTVRTAEEIKSIISYVDFGPNDFNKFINNCNKFFEPKTVLDILQYARVSDIRKNHELNRILFSLSNSLKCPVFAALAAWHQNLQYDEKLRECSARRIKYLSQKRPEQFDFEELFDIIDRAASAMDEVTMDYVVQNKYHEVKYKDTGRDIMMMAAIRKKFYICSKLVESGADPWSMDFHGNDTFLILVHNDYVRGIEYFSKLNGFSPNQGRRNIPPLIYSIMYSCKNSFDFLLSLNGIDVNEEYQGKTALDYCGGCTFYKYPLLDKGAMAKTYDANLEREVLRKKRESDENIRMKQGYKRSEKLRRYNAKLAAVLALSSDSDSSD